MPTGEYCWKKNSGAPWARTSNLCILRLTLSLLRYLGRYVKLDLNSYCMCAIVKPQCELQLNKANTSDKEMSLLDLNIKVIGSYVHTSAYDKRDDFGFPIVNFPWFSGVVPRLQRMVLTFLSWLYLLGVALTFRISLPKIFKLLPNYQHRVTDITSFEKHSENSSGHTLTCCLNLVKYRFKNMLWKEYLTRSSLVI